MLKGENISINFLHYDLESDPPRNEEENEEKKKVSRQSSEEQDGAAGTSSGSRRGSSPVDKLTGFMTSLFAKLNVSSQPKTKVFNENKIMF